MDLFKLQAFLDLLPGLEANQPPIIDRSRIKEITASRIDRDFLNLKPGPDPNLKDCRIREIYLLDWSGKIISPVLTGTIGEKLLRVNPQLIHFVIVDTKNTVTQESYLTIYGLPKDFLLDEWVKGKKAAAIAEIKTILGLA